LYKFDFIIIRIHSIVFENAKQLRIQQLQKYKNVRYSIKKNIVKT